MAESYQPRMPLDPLLTTFQYGGYVKGGYKRKDVLDFPQYAWITCSLDGHLRYFKIYYNDPGVSVDKAKEAVKKELEGPGKMLGNLALHKKVGQEHNLCPMQCTTFIQKALKLVAELEQGKWGQRAT